MCQHSENYSTCRLLRSIIIGVALTLLIIGMGVIASIHPSPTFIVNLPKDRPPMQVLTNTLPVVALNGDTKAILWWTVFKYTIDCGYGSLAAREAASKAVVDCYEK